MQPFFQNVTAHLIFNTSFCIVTRFWSSTNPYVLKTLQPDPLLRNDRTNGLTTRIDRQHVTTYWNIRKMLYHPLPPLLQFCLVDTVSAVSSSSSVPQVIRHSFSTQCTSSFAELQWDASFRQMRIDDIPEDPRTYFILRKRVDNTLRFTHLPLLSTLDLHVC